MRESIKKSCIKKVILSIPRSLASVSSPFLFLFLSHLCTAGLHIRKAEIQTPTLPLSALLAQLPHSPLGLSCQKSPSLPWISTKPGSYLLAHSKICPVGELYTLHAGEGSVHAYERTMTCRCLDIHENHKHTHTHMHEQTYFTLMHTQSFSLTHRMKSACSFSGVNSLSQ